jgi:hypothetical protein
MNRNDTDVDASAIQKFEGTPNKRGRRGEYKRWRRFLDWFAARFEKGDSLADVYLEAKASEAQAEAEIKRERAAEIAAKTDLLRNKAVRQFCDLVDAQFSADDPNLARNLKLAKLIEANPALREQLHLVAELREKLERKKGTRVEPYQDEPPKLLPDEVSDRRDERDPS